MTRLFGERVVLEVGSVRLEGADVQAQVAYQSGGLAESSVRVVLPSARLLSQLAGEQVLCRILAGWADTGAVEIGRGYILPDSIAEEQSGTADTVQWQMVDGVPEVVDRIVAEALPAGSTTVDALRAVARSLGVALDSVTVPAPVTYRTVTALAGRAAGVLDSITDDAGCRWVLTSGRLRVWPRGGEAGRTAVVWSDRQQLLEVTTRAGGRGQATARALLTPSLRPGDTLRVDHRRGTMWLAADEIVHAVDTKGGAHHTLVTGTVQ